MNSNAANAVFEEVHSFQKEAEKSAEVIIAGSDAHLDLILTYTQPLNQLTTELNALNELLYADAVRLSDKEVKVLLPLLADVNKTCLLVIGAVRTSFLYRDVREALKNFSRSHAFLREIIHDLKYFRDTPDPDMDNLLNELNAL